MTKIHTKKREKPDGKVSKRTFIFLSIREFVGTTDKDKKKKTKKREYYMQLFCCLSFHDISFVTLQSIYLKLAFLLGLPNAAAAA